VTATESPPQQQPPPQLAGRRYLALVLLGVVVGLPAAVVAALFLGLVHEAQQALWPDDPAWYLVVGLPVVGAAIVAGARAFLPGDGGHRPLLGLGSPETPLAHVPGIAIAAFATLAFGAVLGPEAPIIALGGAVGIALTSVVRLAEQPRRIVATAGMFSAISALFGGPLVAGVLMVESGVALGARLAPAMLPGFVAAAVGYLLFVGFGDWGGLNAPGLSVPDLPAYTGLHFGDLGVALAVGVLTTVLLFSLKWAAARLEDVGGRRLGMVVLLLAGGLAVGVLAVVENGLGGSSTEILFSGQSAIPDLVKEGSAAILLSILVVKTIAYAISLGCGFRGGPIFPAVFLGIGVAMFPVIWFGTSPTLAVTVGAAAGMAGQTKLILTAIVFAALLAPASAVDATPAVVFAAAAAWLTATTLERRRDAATPAT
jgi:H+/Cl- antiporter ClcA